MERLCFYGEVMFLWRGHQYLSALHRDPESMS
jgi:hypothetical protein